MPPQPSQPLPPLLSSDSELDYLNKIINDVFTSSINQFSKRDYVDVRYNLEKLKLIVKRMDELKTKCDKSQSFKLYMSLVLNRFMAYLSSPSEESRVAKLCEVVFDDEYAFALTHQELNDLQVHLCKHLMYLIEQAFFHENKEIMDEYVDKYGVWVANDCGSASQMPNYSLKQMLQVMDEYLKQYVDDENDRDSLLRQHEACEKRKNDESHSAATSTTLSQNIKKLKLTSENKSNKTTVAASRDTEQSSSSTKSTTSRPLESLDSQKSRQRLDVNNNHDIDVPDLDFGDDEEETENVVIKKKTNTSPLCVRNDETEKSHEEGNATKKVVSSGALTFKRRDRPTVASNSSSGIHWATTSSDEDQEYRQVEVTQAASNIMTFSSRDAANFTELSDTESETDRAKSLFNIKDPRTKKMWSLEETLYLVLGVARFSKHKHKWKRILKEYSTEFDDRDNVALKDRWRTLEENRVSGSKLSPQETFYLVWCVLKFGEGKWIRILDQFKTEFDNREIMALKDRWRTLEENKVEMRMYKKIVGEYRKNS